MPIFLSPLHLSSFCSAYSFFLFLPHSFPLNFWSTCCSGMMTIIYFLLLRNTELTVIQTEQGKGEQGKEDESGVLVRCPKRSQQPCLCAMTDLAGVEVTDVTFSPEGHLRFFFHEAWCHSPSPRFPLHFHQYNLSIYFFIHKMFPFLGSMFLKS